MVIFFNLSYVISILTFFLFKIVLFLFYCLNLNSLCGISLHFFSLMLMYIKSIDFVYSCIFFMGVTHEMCHKKTIFILHTF